MKCPVDGRELVMSERSGVEIDSCPECRGVWLDRGELDRIATRMDADPWSGSDDRDGRDGRDGRDRRDRRDRRDPAPTATPHAKRRSWFSELMEFGD